MTKSSKLVCPAILNPRDEEKLRRSSPDDFQKYEKLLGKLSEAMETHEHLLGKVDASERAYGKMCEDIEKFTHEVRIFLRQQSLFGD
jgi:hypothetical protein